MDIWLHLQPKGGDMHEKLKSNSSIMRLKTSSYKRITIILYLLPLKYLNIRHFDRKRLREIFQATLCKLTSD
jgi:hypothetical protein